MTGAPSKPAPGRPAPLSPAERAEQLINLTERLTLLLADQAKAFEARRPHEAARNMEETSRLANVYRFEAQRLRADPRLLQGLPLALRTRLIRATEAFDAVIARQGRALYAAKTITEGLVHAVAKEVAHQRDARAPYGPGGVKSAGGGATPVALNRKA
jgi:hypothetical protein